MSYSEKDGQVILTLSRKDWRRLNRAIEFLLADPFVQAAAAELLRQINAGNPNYVDLLNMLNSGNPHYTPYPVEEKK